jgi:hypothetical protein
MSSFWTLQIWHAYELRHHLHWRGHGHTTLAWVQSQVIEQMGSFGRRVGMPACPRGGVGAGRVGACGGRRRRGRWLEVARGRIANGSRRARRSALARQLAGRASAADEGVDGADREREAACGALGVGGALAGQAVVRGRARAEGNEADWRVTVTGGGSVRTGARVGARRGRGDLGGKAESWGGSDWVPRGHGGAGAPARSGEEKS